MCGGRFSIARRSCINVSPVRTATRISGISSPRSPAFCKISASGPSRFFWMSFPSAFRGETYTTSVVSVSSPLNALRTRRSMHARNAASVFPDPVGAEITVERRARICGQPRTCGSVADSNRSRNHSRTIGCAQSSACASAPVPGSLARESIPRESLCAIAGHICRNKRGKPRGHIDIITPPRISAKSPRSVLMTDVNAACPAPGGSGPPGVLYAGGHAGDPRLFTQPRLRLLAPASSDSAYIAPSAVSSCLKYVNTSASRAICPTFNASALRLSSE